jgi:uncharacterized protein (TIGR03437 family)
MQKPVAIAILFLCALAVPRAFSQQTVVTTITTLPAGLQYSVDGQTFVGNSSFAWPLGSQHTLYVTQPLQQDNLGTTQYAFSGWSSEGNIFTGNPLSITADPGYTSYQANFGVAFKFTLRYYLCLDPSQCLTPGIVYIDNTPAYGDTDLYFPAGSQVTLQAVPNANYVFGGWNPGPNQVIKGAIDTVTMLAPVEASPVFQVARTINFNAIPAGFQVLVDRTANQTYQVAPLMTPDTLTATYIQAERVDVLTSPAGFPITVDGLSNWVSYYFLWGAGTTHVLSAPTQQTDSQGRIWTFSSWSNGAAQTQNFIVPSDPTSLANGVSVTATYQAMGRVTLSTSLAGLSVLVDGNSCPTPCDVQRPQGSQVHITAPSSLPLAAGTRADFLSWSDGGPADRIITLGAQAIQLTANYHLMNQLTATSSPVNGVSWAFNPTSPDGFYDSQTTVAVTANPLPGFRFLAWSGDLSGSTPSGTVAMNVPRSVEALLARIPYVAPPGVVNAAAITPQSGIAPGSIASIYGGMLGTDAETGPSSPLVQTLAGVTVTAAGRILPLFYVSPTQINFLLPSDFPLGQAAATIVTPNQTLTTTFTVVQDAPGLFQQVANNQAFATAFHQDGSVVTSGSPAEIGETVTIYGTGFGPTTPLRPTGFAVPAQPVFQVTDPVTVTIATDAPLTPTGGFAVPGLVGVDALQFQITDSSLSGSNAPLYVTINGQNSNTVLLPVQ